MSYAKAVILDVRLRPASKFGRNHTSVWILDVFSEFLGVIYVHTSTNGSPAMNYGISNLCFSYDLTLGCRGCLANMYAYVGITSLYRTSVADTKFLPRDALRRARYCHRPSVATVA